MGSWWRSQEMTYVSMIVSEEAAPASIRELGVLGCMQFTDLNPDLTPFQRPYVSFIKRCDEMERKIRYLHGETKKLNIPVLSAGSVNQFVTNATGSEVNNGSYLLEGIESKLTSNENQLLDLNKFGSRLHEEYQAKLQMHHVLTKARQLFAAEMSAIASAELSAAAATTTITSDGEHEQGIALNTFAGGSSNDHDGEAGYISYNTVSVNELAFSNIAGVMRNADRVRFERMLYRATRGNCWVRFVDILDYDTPNSIATEGRAGTDVAGGGGTSSELALLNILCETDNVDKSVFIIFFKSTSIQSKIRRICEAFQAQVYNIQSLDRPEDLEAQQRANDAEMDDARKVLLKNLQAKAVVCRLVARSLEEWLWTVRREKGMYHTLNMMSSDVAGNLLRARGWLVTSQMENARNVINKAHMQLSLPPTALLDKVPGKWPSAPTHFNTNKYTDAFQEFVNTYGVPRYREANPALFTAATFPFLFGIMYGDIGHGSCLTLFALFLILTESVGDQRGAGEMVKGVYGARYMLFAMGLCAVYAGTVYNDYFSLGLATWPSSFVFEHQEAGEDATQIGPYGDAANVYPYGIDPAWKISSNALLFFNSFKMKLSVVLGITQMTWGICLKGINAVYFNQWLDFYCEFIPMMLFDMAFFGYMLILIFVKWSIDWDARMALGTCGYDEQGTLGACQLGNGVVSCFDVNHQECNALTPLSDMCPLGMGGTSGGCQPPNLITTLMSMALAPGTVDEPMFMGQAGLQSFLLVVAFISVPWLLCVKPFLLKREQQRQMALEERGRTSSGSDNGLIDEGECESETGGSGSSSVNKRGGGASTIHASDVVLVASSDAHGHGEEFNFGEIVIHQAIETIEFVLGMVSNTASYLRLWALSLAHSELAEVFWDKALLGMVSAGSPVGIYIGLAVFAAVTFAVLLCMDVLECFLHALRLHWVEFQNKFYKADGHRFQPFDYKAIIGRASLE